MTKHRPTSRSLRIQASWLLLALCASASAATHTVGPPTGGACGGSDCDFNSIQAAIDAATAGDTITIYRRTDDATNNECYDEHITVDKSLTLSGASTTPSSATCIGPSTGGNIVVVTASNVTLQKLHISGRANNGAGGSNSVGSGGRAFGHGVYITGHDLDGTIIKNCSVDNTFGDNIRFQGDQDGDGDGYVIIKHCYLHHSDNLRNIRIKGGGGSASDKHIIRNCLIHTGHGILVSAPFDYITIERNIIKGWPFWGHLGGFYPDFPETRDGSHGGGWRYYSNCANGIWIADTAPTDVTIRNNLIVSPRIGIRVNTTGTIRHNTIVNPFNTAQYDYTGTVLASDIRDETFGIMLTSGFSGTIQNNIIAVTADNRANGSSGSGTAAYYTPGITGYGIAFEDNSGTLGGGANITHNNVWGFVDTDGSAPLNYGSGIPQGNTNISVDPHFATDTSDETNGGTGPCPADGNDVGDVRCYELYEDNFLLASSNSAGGSCHANIIENAAGAPEFIDLSNNGAKDPDTDFLSGLEECTFATDAENSRAIDFATGTVGSEGGDNGGAPNLGAFGGTDRASQSPTLRIMAVDVGDGGVKNGDSTAQTPGIVQPRSDGLTTVNIYFSRAVTATSSSFLVRDYCDMRDLAAPISVDTTEAAAPPYKVALTWTAGTFTDDAVRVHVLGDGPDRVVAADNVDALDGEITDLENGPLPSGDSTSGGDAEFIVYALTGDIDGDRAVEGQSGEHDYDAVTGFTGYPAGACTACPEDADGDGDVDAADLAVVTGQDDDVPGPQWFNSAWTHRRRITIDSNQVSTVASTDLSDFPLLINSTDATWRDAANSGNVAQSDGGDFVFTEADGTTQLDHEIESYDPVTGALVAWVEVPSVSATADTDVFIYYGNAASANQWNVAGTWDTSHQAVWHLGEDAGDVLEFDTITGQAPSLVQVSGDVHAIAYTGDFDDGWLATVDINADGGIDDAVIDTLEFDTVTGNDPHIIPIAGDIFALVYSGPTNDGNLMTLDIDPSGSPITVVDSTTFDGSNCQAPRITAVAGDIYAIVYSNSAGKGELRTVDIAADGTINDSGVDTLEFASVRAVTPGIAAVAGDIYAIAASGPQFDGWLTTVDIDPSGTPLSVVDTFEFDTADCADPDIVSVAGDIFAIAYEGSTGDGFIKTLDIAASGTPISLVDTLEFDAEDGAKPNIIGVAGDIFALAYEGPSHTGGMSLSGHLITLDIDASGTPLSILDQLDYDAEQGDMPAILPVSGDLHAIAYSGPGDDGLLKTVDITSNGLIGELADSTASASYAQGVATAVSGQIASAQDLDGTDDFLRLSNATTYDTGLDATGALSLSLWFYPDDVDSILFDNRWQDAVQEEGYHLSTDAAGNVVFAAGDGTNANGSGIAVSAGAITVSQWNHIAVTKAAGSSTINFYVNGSAAGTDTINSATIAYDSGVVSRLLGTSTDAEPYGGSNGFGSRQFTDGKLDELRISTTQRSADWIITSYNNHSSPSTFYTICTEQP